MSEYSHQPVTVDSKVAAVIGGTSGIGRAIALGFATEGADVVATSRDLEKVKHTTADIDRLGTSTFEQTVDVTDRSSLEQLRNRMVQSFGDIDVLVLSQGAISRDELVQVNETEWNRVVGVILDGSYRAIQIFADVMENGSIILVSSLAARLSLRNASAYSASKGGVEALTRAAAKELAPDIRVNAIAPGFVITPQNEQEYAEGTAKRKRIRERTLLSRVADPEEIVGGAIYLASEASSYTTGETLTIDGGFANSAL